MKAVQKTAPGVGNVALREVPEPTPGPGQVVLEVAYTGICGTDLHIFLDEYRSVRRSRSATRSAPAWPRSGRGVAGVAVGDRVVTETYFHTCGRCLHCGSGRPNLCAGAPVTRHPRRRRLRPLRARPGPAAPPRPGRARRPLGRAGRAAGLLHPRALRPGDDPARRPGRRLGAGADRPALPTARPGGRRPDGPGRRAGRRRAASRPAGRSAPTGSSTSRPSRWPSWSPS